MTTTNCLNCEKPLTDQFCSGCGQKADTHRITFKHFIFHDILHGTFHIEKGILFTAKQALLRPGKAAIDYISGKRKRYYNVFYLILITTGLILFILHFFDELELLMGQKAAPKVPFTDEPSIKLDKIFSQSKIIIFLFVPFGALNSFLLFRRKKWNLAEHAILSGMILLGMLLLSAFGNLLFNLQLFIPFNAAFSFLLSKTILFFIIFHVGYGYFNAFNTNYSRLGITYRIVLFYVLVALEMLLLLYIAIGFVTDWKFGTVHMSPFG